MPAAEKYIAIYTDEADTPITRNSRAAVENSFCEIFQTTQICRILRNSLPPGADSARVLTELRQNLSLVKVEELPLVRADLLHIDFVVSGVDELPEHLAVRLRVG